uniref:rho GTPase-activating protein 15-like isoform X2 n=1 Tax=Myxine glutinosa TaxID=7769 RepID=UPI00358FAD4E
MDMSVGSRAEAPSRHGTISSMVRALYSYEYVGTDGCVISMTEGEEFNLLKKSNEDWWHVQRLDGTKPIYVPASYVEEFFQPSTSTREIPSSPVLTTFGKKATNDRVPFNPCTGLRNGSVQQSLNEGLRTTGENAFEEDGRKDEEESVYAEVSLYAQGEASEHGSTGSCSAMRSDSPVYANLEELKLAPMFDQPPSPITTTLMSSDGWEMHHDELSGRAFYHNVHTHEKSWKPPRRGRPATPPPDYDQELLDPGVTEGWREEEDEHGEMTFTHPTSPNTWKKSSDHQGKVYYYTNKGDSVWKLPQVTSSSSTLSKSAENMSRIETSSIKTSGSDSPSSDQSGSTFPISSSSRMPFVGSSVNPSSPGSPASSAAVLEPFASVGPIKSTWQVPSSNAKSEMVFDRDGSVTMVNWRKKTSGPNSLDRASLAKSVAIPEVPKTLQHRRNLSDHGLSTLALPATAAPSVPNLEKAGVLNKTKIMETSKKLRKNWTPSWVVLSGPYLTFGKDPKAQASASWKPGIAQSLVDLRKARINWTKEKSSKKNVFQLSTPEGDGYLLQDESHIIALEWFNAIQTNIHKHEKDGIARDDVFLHTIKYGGDSLPNADLKVDEGIDGSQKDKIRLRGKTPPVIDSVDKRKAIKKLLKFFPKRPTIQSLRDKGIIKEQVFGCPLAELCKRENCTVPKFVQLCIEAVEKRGLDVDGIYRVSGNLATIQKLRFAVDHDDNAILGETHMEDIHVITGAFKMFFRELPEPLFPFNAFDEFISAIKIPDASKKLQTIKEHVKKLPEANHDTMRSLFEHLKKVIASGPTNRMTTQSISIVFGPTLLRPEMETGNMAFHLVYQNQIVEFVLNNFSSLFTS